MQPRSVTRDGNCVRIVWEDGHESVYELHYLRRKCPCVMCKNAPQRSPDGGVELPSFQAGPPLDLVKSEPVGRYAIQFAFNDGHDTGIYSFDHLRKVCPCPDCAPTQVNIPST
ncbi:MAG: DUF971 domain-containing protein [bacterium]